MFIGHGFAAVIVAIAVIRVAFPEFRDREFRIAIVAFGFGVLPDIDMVYAFLETPLRLTNDLLLLLSPSSARSVFWSATSVHRGLSHSMLVGAVVSVFLYRLAKDRRAYAGSIEIRRFTVAQFYELTTNPTRRLLFVLAFVSVFATGIGEFVVFWVVVAVATLGTLRLIESQLVGPDGLFLAAAVGLLTHPLGDLWLGPSFDIFAPLPSETTQLQPLFGHESLHYTLSYGIEAAISLTGLLLLLTAYRNCGIQEAVELVFRPRADLRFAVVVAVLLAALYLPFSYSVLQETYEITIIALTVPIVLCAAVYYRWTDSHTAVSMVYVLFVTQVVATLVLSVAIVLEAAPPVEALLEFLWGRFLAFLEYLRAVYDGRGLNAIGVDL